jgi:hypothetical protein
LVKHRLSYHQAKLNSEKGGDHKISHLSHDSMQVPPNAL